MCPGWQLDLSKYWTFAVSFLNKSVSNQTINIDGDRLVQERNGFGGSIVSCCKFDIWVLVIDKF